MSGTYGQDDNLETVRGVFNGLRSESRYDLFQQLDDDPVTADTAEYDVSPGTARTHLNDLVETGLADKTYDDGEPVYQQTVLGAYVDEWWDDRWEEYTATADGVDDQETFIVTASDALKLDGFDFFMDVDDIDAVSAYAERTDRNPSTVSRYRNQQELLGLIADLELTPAGEQMYEAITRFDHTFQMYKKQNAVDSGQRTQFSPELEEIIDGLVITESMDERERITNRIADSDEDDNPGGQERYGYDTPDDRHEPDTSI